MLDTIVPGAFVWLKAATGIVIVVLAVVTRVAFLPANAGFLVRKTKNARASTNWKV